VGGESLDAVIYVRRPFTDATVSIIVAPSISPPIISETSTAIRRPRTVILTSSGDMNTFRAGVVFARIKLAHRLCRGRELA